MQIRLSVIIAATATIAMAQLPSASTVFDKDAVHEIRLTFSQSDWWNILTTNYTENEDDVPYTEAALKWGDYKFDVVGVRFKGNSSYNGATTKKKPFRIKLNEFVKGQKIDGMASFSLSNAWNDPSFVREKPYYELAAAAGLKSPRSSFAALYINDEYWGLYVLTEVVNGDFLKNFFGKGNDGGNLYKADDIGTSFEYLGTDPASYKTTWEKQSNEDADDWTDLVQLCKTLNEATADDIEAKLDPLIDIDSVLTALALDNLTVNLDSYVSMGQNFYIYRRTTDSKFVWIPWDPSLAFGALSQGLTIQQMKELALEYVQASGGGAGGQGGSQQAGRPLATKLWQSAKYKQRYREIYAQMVEKVLIPDTLIARMTALREMIRPWVVADTQKLVTQDQFDQAMTTDMTSSAGGGGTTNPGGGQTGGGAPPTGGGTTPPTGGGDPTGGTPPTGGGAPTGGQAGGGSSSGVPGLTPFITGRVAAVKALLTGATPLTVSASPASLQFVRTVTGSAVAQTVQLALSDASTNGTFTASSSADWATVTPASGSLPAALSVSAGGASLAAGTYNATVTVAASGATNSPLSIPVTLTVTSSPALIASPSSLAFSGGGQGLNSQAIQVTATSATAFSATVSDSSCGTFLTVSASSGATPATVTATVNTSGVTASTCTANILIAASGMTTVKIPVTWSSGAASGPTITSILNGASYAASAIAPGEVVTLFGTSLGPATAASGGFQGGRWATSVAGVQVTFDGTAAPILYVKDTQIAVIAPFELAGKTQTSVQVAMNQQRSAAVLAAVTTVAPGVFTADSSGAGAAARVTTAGLASGAKAVAKGETFSILATGLGWLDPTPATGALGSAAAPRKATSVVAATIGGQPAAVAYAGTNPNSPLGVYRIDLVMPATVSSGDARLILAVDGVPAQSGLTVPVE